MGKPATLPRSTGFHADASGARQRVPMISAPCFQGNRFALSWIRRDARSPSRTPPEGKRIYARKMRDPHPPPPRSVAKPSGAKDEIIKTKERGAAASTKACRLWRTRNRAKRYLEARGFRVAPISRNGEPNGEPMDLVDMVGTQEKEIVFLAARIGNGISARERRQLQSIPVPKNAIKILFLWPELQAGESGVDAVVEYL